jgi:hypothetical protein
MVFFSKFKISKHKKHRSSLLLIRQEQTIFNLAFQRTKKKSFKQNQNKLVQNSKTFQELQKNKDLLYLVPGLPICINS